jgi:hypothetical protein
MSLVLPIPTVELGPAWASELYNSLFYQVDAHNHSSGNGVQINPNGLNINADLSFGSNNATLLRSTRYVPQGMPLAAATDLGCVYVSGADLYYNDTAGNQVKITSGGLVNATSGGIMNGTATASFVSGVLVVNQNTNTPGNIQAGSILIGNNTAGSNFITLSAPPGLSTSYPLYLPPSLPGSGSTSLLQLDSSGNITANTTITLTGTAIAVAGGVYPGGTGNSLISATPTYATITSSSSLIPYAVVTSPIPATSAIHVIRGVISAAGGIVSGEGFTLFKGSAGRYSINFINPFFDTPAVTVTPVNTGGPTGTMLIAQCPLILNTYVQISITEVSPQQFIDNVFSFIAVGQQHL